MTKREAIIFDMDGLMVDTEPLSHRAWNTLLRPYHHQLTPNLIEQMIGLRAEKSAALVKATFDLPLSVDEIIRRRGPIYAKIRANGVRPMPGLHELHAVIAEQRIPWAVATSSSREHAVEILEQLNLWPTEGVMACGNEVPHGKPAPDIYLLAAERLGIAPERCIALEDSGPGSRAAVAAGMLTVAIPNGYTKTAVFAHAHYIFDSLFEVKTNLALLLAG
ncbi:MAG: HAD family phosphatase [Anaerolineales bacterium]|nr:HAD family phosphatase [Anaerolineales bacterium]